MILPYDANPGRMEFSERTALFSDYKSVGYAKIPYAPEQGIFWS